MHRIKQHSSGHGFNMWVQPMGHLGVRKAYSAYMSLRRLNADLCSTLDYSCAQDHLIYCTKFHSLIQTQKNMQVGLHVFTRPANAWLALTPTDSVQYEDLHLWPSVIILDHNIYSTVLKVMKYAEPYACYCRQHQTLECVSGTQCVSGGQTNYLRETEQKQR